MRSGAFRIGFCALLAAFAESFAPRRNPQLLATALGGDERCLGAIRDEAGLELNLRAICFSMKRPAVPSI